jgi:hypothetical protein
MPGSWRRPVAPACPPELARSKVKALHNSDPSGYATITHPFHPLRNQRFPILKTRIVSGCQTLSIQAADRGTFAVPLEWTDQNSDPSFDTHLQDKLVLTFQGLLSLNDLFKKLDTSNK